MINALTYADDIVLLSTTKEGLEIAIDTVHKYCINWKLKIDSSKTKTLIFSRGNQKTRQTNTILENKQSNCSPTATDREIEAGETRE